MRREKRMKNLKENKSQTITLMQQRAFSAFVDHRNKQFKELHVSPKQVMAEKILLKEEIESLKELYNQKQNQNKILLTKIHSS